MTDTITGTFELGPNSGQLRIKTGRAGLAAKVGHDLTIGVTQWSAKATIPGDAEGGLAAATVTAELDLGSLVILEGSGGAKPLSDKDRKDILNTAKKTLGDGATATFTSTKVTPSGAGGSIEGTFTLRGNSQPVRFEVTSSGPGKYAGSATLLQTGFGITPYSGFFGALKLKDEVVAEFEVNVG